ncbi:MAG: hypothetical protein Q9P01_20400 [Anaerolineae bacterium]|nr:hypothetical protein [Anaerolineae bacterium]MDQ7037109.1 hypothetical protein [Anaerolineae bacterium]
MYKQEDKADSNHICPRCQIGRIHLRFRPYLELHQGHLFTIPDAICYECDVCGYVEFDEAILEVIEAIVLGVSTQVDKIPDETIYHQATTKDDKLTTKPIQP